MKNIKTINKPKKVNDTKLLKHHNIFLNPDWQEYDYQQDIRNDPALQSTKQRGREMK